MVQRNAVVYCDVPDSNLGWSWFITNILHLCSLAIEKYICVVAADVLIHILFTVYFTVWFPTKIRHFEVNIEYTNIQFWARVNGIHENY